MDIRRRLEETWTGTVAVFANVICMWAGALESIDSTDFVRTTRPPLLKNCMRHGRLEALSSSPLIVCACAN